MGVCTSKSDFDVFKDVIRFSNEIEELPYRVDKLFWLVGSGNFYLDNIKVRTNRDEFINSLTNEVEG